MKACGAAGAAADYIRTRRQPQDCEGARLKGSALDPRPRRRGHRVKRICLTGLTVGAILANILNKRIGHAT